VESWATQGPVYQRMFKLIHCRKIGGTPEMVPLGATMESAHRGGEAENPNTLAEVLGQIETAAESERDYPSLLRDMHGALQAMSEANWAAIRRELMSLIQEEVPDTR
jgi:hypothetical protein